jgi:hypothetical protein
MEASVKTQLRIRDDISKVSDMVNQIEWLRKQLEDMQKMLGPQRAAGRGGAGGGRGGAGGAVRPEAAVSGGARGGQAAEPAGAAGPEQAGRAEVLKAIEALDQKMQDVEYKLFSKALRTSDDKYHVEAYKLYLNLIWLNGEVGTGAGDVAGGADFFHAL